MIWRAFLFMTLERNLRISPTFYSSLEMEDYAALMCSTISGYLHQKTKTNLKRWDIVVIVTNLQALT